MATLSRDQAIAYVIQNASKYNLDPAALLSVAEGEGLNHAPTPWTVPGEDYPSFGPPSWFGGGAGAKYLAQFGGNANAAAAWAWSPDGLDAWMREASQSKGVAGTTGNAAIYNLVTNFERPAARYVSGNITDAIARYAKYEAQVLTSGITGSAGGSGGTVTDPPEGNPIVPVPPNSGGTTTPGTGGVTTGAGAAGGSQDVKLGSIGPVDVAIPSGLVLGLFGMGLLALGALLFVGGNRLKTNIGTVGGTVIRRPNVRGQII
jgi:hypothetical protein